MIGDSSTFSAPVEIELPLRQQISVPIQIHVAENGLYSALLRLSLKSDGHFAAQFGMTVICADQLDKHDQLGFVGRGVVSRNRAGRVFLEVPAHLSGIDLAFRSTAAVDVSAWQATSQLKVNRSSAGSYTIEDPAAGLVEVLVTLSDDLPPDSIALEPFRFTAKGVPPRISLGCANDDEFPIGCSYQNHEPARLRRWKYFSRSRNSDPSFVSFHDRLRDGQAHALFPELCDLD